MPNALDLTTLAAVRRFLQVPDNVTGQDPLISDLITRVSVLVQNEFPERRFLPTTGARSFSYAGGPRIHVGDVRAVTAVTLDSDSTSPLDLAAGSWVLRPADAPGGVYRTVQITGYGYGYPCRSRDQAATVTGSWGFAAVPADVEHACIVTVRDWLKYDVAFTDTGDRVTIGGDTLPPRILRGLEHYRIPAV